MKGRLAVIAGAGLGVGVFALFALVIATLFAIRAGVTMALPWWVGLVAPLALYAVLAAMGQPRMSVSSWATAFAALCGVYAVVALLTAVLVAAIADMSVPSALGAASLSFMPAPLLQLLVVPLMLLPVRTALTRRPRPRARRAETEADWSRPKSETLPGWQVGRPVGTVPAGAAAVPSPTRVVAPDPEPEAVFSVPGSTATPRPVATPAPTAPAEPAPVLSAPGATLPPRSAPPAAAAVAAAAPVVAAPARPVAPPPPVASPAVAAPPPEITAPPRRIVAIVEPPAVAPEPSVPAHAAAPMAAAAPPEPAPAAAPDQTRQAPRVPEGDTIAIPFARIATVLPADLLASDAARVSEGLAAPGTLLVPVALVVPQLADGFVAVEWKDVMGQFPAGAFRVPVADVAERLPEGRVPLPLDEVVRRLPPEIFAMATPAADLGTLESFPLPFQPLEAAPPLPAPPVAAEAPVEEPSEPSPVEAATAASGPPVEPSTVASDEVPAPTREDPLEEEPADGPPRLARLARALSPVGSLSGSVADLDGHGVYLFCPPDLEPESLLSTVGPALDVLRGPSSTLSQLTVRMERGAVVLTPLAAQSGAATLVAAASTLDGSLALLELLSLRCGAPSTAAGEATDGAGLEPVAGGPAADLLAGALTAFGALAPAVIRDPDGRAELCLLHAPGEPTREVARIGHAVCLALAAMDGRGLGPVRSAALRVSPAPDGVDRRLAVRPVAGRPGHWIALAAPAGDARPGLVEIEISRAAARAAR